MLLSPFSLPSSLVNACQQVLLATPPPPPKPSLEDFPSPPPTAPSLPPSSITPIPSFRRLHRRSKPLLVQPFAPTLTSSTSYASLHSRANHYPSNFITLSTVGSSYTPSVRHAIYVSAPKTSLPPSPTTPTPTERAPPLKSVSSIPLPDPAPFASTGGLKAYPSWLSEGESSQWSVASTSRRSPTPTPNSMPILPSFIRPSPKPKRKLLSIRTRLLSTFRLRPRSTAPPSPTIRGRYRAL
jgi:hypothetical protein